MNVLKWLLHRPTWHKLPMLPRMYRVEYDPRSVDRDTQILMELTHIRCPRGVEVLKKRYGVDARTLIQHLPTRRRKRDIGARIAQVMRRAWGVTPYDPMVSITRQMRRGRRRS